MRRNTTWQVMAAVLVGSMALPAQDEEKLISGRVVDTEGQPIANATVGTSWSFLGEPQPTIGAGRAKGEVKRRKRVRGADGDQRDMPDWYWGQGVTTDADGRFEGMFRIRWNAVTLMAYSDDRRLSGLLRLDPTAPGEEVTLTLQPSVRVHCTFTCTDLGRPVVGPYIYLFMRADPRRLLLGSSHGTQFDMPLPPGEYFLYLYGQDMDSISYPFDAPAGRAQLKIGRIDIPASFFTLHRGRLLPEWNVTEARGVPEGATSLESFRGKWLVVEFWGFW